MHGAAYSRSVSADQQPPSGFSPAGPNVDGSAYRGLLGTRPRGSNTLVRIVVAVLALVLLVGAATHIAPAIRAGLHEGTRGYWIATGRTCSRNACLWNGKFVVPGGHVLATKLDYDGAVPTGIHAGTRIAGLYPGGSLVFPTTGSDLWISLLVAILVGLLGLYWATHRWVAGYLRQRADSVGTGLAPPLP